MPRKANPHNEAESQRPLVDDLCVELVDFGSDFPIFAAELDALERSIRQKLADAQARADWLDARDDREADGIRQHARAQPRRQAWPSMPGVTSVTKSGTNVAEADQATSMVEASGTKSSGLVRSLAWAMTR